MLTGGVLYDRYHTRVIYYYRGLAQVMPVFSTLYLIATVLNMGQPLSLNWLGEFTSLMGVYSHSPVMTAVASSVQVLSAAYAIWVYVRMTSGSVSPYLTLPSPDVTGTSSSATTAVQPVAGDVTRREYTCLAYLLVPAVAFGVYAVPLTNVMTGSLSTLLV